MTSAEEPNLTRAYVVLGVCFVSFGALSTVLPLSWLHVLTAFTLGAGTMTILLLERHLDGVRRTRKAFEAFGAAIAAERASTKEGRALLENTTAALEAFREAARVPRPKKTLH